MLSCTDMHPCLKGQCGRGTCQLASGPGSQVHLHSLHCHPAWASCPSDSYHSRPHASFCTASLSLLIHTPLCFLILVLLIAPSLPWMLPVAAGTSMLSMNDRLLRCLCPALPQVQDVGGIVERLLGFLEVGKPFVTAEAVTQIADLLRRFPELAEICISSVSQISPQVCLV